MIPEEWVANTGHPPQEAELVIAHEYEARKQLDETRKELGMKHLAMSSLEHQLDGARKELADQQVGKSSLQKQLDGHRKELANQQLEKSSLQKQFDEMRQVSQPLTKIPPL